MPIPKTWKTCSFCGRQVYKLANPSRGLCAACYYREKKNGDLAYKPLRVRKPCSIDGCNAPSVAQGHCETHYRRFRRHGVAEHERFDRWGHKEAHPMRDVHYHMIRAYRAEVCDEWKNDFWKFIADIGERPSDRHRFKRLDPSKPYQIGNVFWEAPKLDVPVTTKAQAAEYARAYRAANPDLYRDQHLRKKYGVSLEWYNKQLEAQGGVCAICGNTEGATHQKTGLPRSYAVDHCHTGGHVRELLCSKCNTGLGSFRDDPALLQAAIAYLAKHAIAEAA